MGVPSSERLIFLGGGLPVTYLTEFLFLRTTRKATVFESTKEKWRIFNILINFVIPNDVVFVVFVIFVSDLMSLSNFLHPRFSIRCR